MALTTGNVLVGVCSIWTAPVATAQDTAHGAPWVESGYTEDGVMVTYTPTSVMDIDVEEETFSTKRVLEKEEVEITLNMAESTLANLDDAMAGAVLAGVTVTLGGGVMKELAVEIIGVDMGDGGLTDRIVYMGYANATGIVGMPYRKGTKTIVPVTFKGYLSAHGATVCNIEDF